MATLYYERINTNSLQHHGIQGQKWGVKNGPPYPLDEKDHSAAEKKAENGTSKSKKPGLQLTDKQKQYIKIGLIAAGVTVAAIGTYQLAKAGAFSDLSVLGKQKIARILGKNKGSGDFLNDLDTLASITGTGRNSLPLSIAESTSKVNPGYKTGMPEFKNNCFSAVTADLINRADMGNGLNVVARPATSQELLDGGLSFNKVLNTFKGSSIDDILIKKDAIASGKIKENLSDQILNKCGNQDGFGIIRVYKTNQSNTGHYIKWEIVNGKVTFSDSLSGSIERADRYIANLGGALARGVEFARVDGLEIDPVMLMKIVSAG